MRKKILFIVNVDWFFVSHRLLIALKAIDEGYEVHLACRVTDEYDFLTSKGIVVHDLMMSRSGKSLFAEFDTCLKLYNVVKKIRPDVLHAVTVKPVLYGGAIARLLRIKSCVFSISGLGYVFSAKNLKAKLLKFLVSLFYKISIDKDNHKVIFQNQNDLDQLVNLGAIKTENVVLIPGSGVDLSLYNVIGKPKDELAIVMASRLLKEKGVLEYVEAAKVIKEKYPDVEFYLAGEPDHENPNSITHKEMKVWAEGGYINLLGHVQDMPELLSKASIFVLPSFYGEGLPKALIEAAACGCPVVTTDHPGCRDAVIENETGLLVPVNNVAALVDAIVYLINDPEKRSQMGEAARCLAEKKFSVDLVVNKHMQIYKGFGF